MRLESDAVSVDNDFRKLLTLDEVATILDCSKTWLYDGSAEAAGLRIMKMGVKFKRVRPADLEAFMECCYD